VARTLTEPATAPPQREVLLKELAAKVDSSVPRDVFVALLAQLLRADCAQNADWVLQKLNELRDRAAPEQRWRLTAAIKAGINFGDLSQLAAALKPPASDMATRWLHDLGHLSVQDQESFAHATTAEDRGAALDRIDFRRATLVDGKYGAIAVIETTTRDDNNASAARKSGPARWKGPERTAVVLAPVTIVSDADRPDGDDQKFRVMADEKKIGDGIELNKPKSIGGPARFSPALQAAAWSELSEGRLTPPSMIDNAVGPLTLQHRAIVNPLTPGTMTIDIANPLRAALRAGSQWTGERVDQIVPAAIPITLRYAAFGSYYGCIPEPPAPDAEQPVRLLGAMLILEKMD